jgi:glutamate racemase
VVVSVACPRLVPLIEAAAPTEALQEAVRRYAAPLKRAGVDTVVLGCTHYPLLRPVFERVFGRGTTLIFSAEETAREVAETLARRHVENDVGRDGACTFLTTGSPDEFRRLGERFLQLPIAAVDVVSIRELERAAA